MGARFLFLVPAVLASSPAWAQASTSVPEGSSVTLFALGLLGVIVGRRAAISAKRREQNRD